jgi:hypothetical protein
LRIPMIRGRPPSSRERLRGSRRVQVGVLVARVAVSIQGGGGGEGSAHGKSIVGRVQTETPGGCRAFEDR